jgi:hypothetical protein
VFLVAAIGLIMAQPGANAARQEEPSEARGGATVVAGANLSHSRIRLIG